MDDMISRSEAIRIASGYCHWSNIPAELAKLPSVSTEKTGRWIPVSEGLPEEFEDVLVWFEYFRFGDYNCLYQTYGIGTYYTVLDSWLVNHESGWQELRIIAYMPLPKPYTVEKMEGVEETETCKDCTNKCIMYEPNMKGCKDKMEGVEE